MQFVLIGTPGHRRTRLFQSALERVGLPPATVHPWQNIDTPFTLPHSSQSTVLRIDSPSLNFEAQRMFLEWGAPLMQSQTGECLSAEKANVWEPDGSGLRYPKQQYLGFCKALQHIELSSYQRCTHTSTNIETMGNKFLCHQLFEIANLPIPKKIAANSYEELQEQMLAQQIDRVFVKLLYGSSASGIVAYECNKQRECAITHIRSTKETFLNSLRTHYYKTQSEIQKIFDWLFAEGALVEQWLPKMCLENDEFDLRIVVIGGKACHYVIRVSQEENPMTNLHLGNKRGDSRVFQDAIGAETWYEVCRLSEQAAALFPGSHCVGVDIMLTPQKQPILLEVNAFGDLLPGIMWQGMDTYEAQIRALLS